MADWFTENAPTGQSIPPPAPPAASTVTPTVATGDDWFGKHAPKRPEPSPIEKTGRAFVEGLGIPTLFDLTSGDETRAKRAIQTLAGGIAGEPGRVWGELSNLGQSMLRGDLTGMGYHAAGAVPFFGAPVQQITQDVARGDPAAAVGHLGALVAPFLAGPAVSAAGRGIATTGTVARGAVSGAAGAIPEAAAAALEKSFYGALGGPEAMVAAAKVAAAKELGQGAITGAKTALAERAAARAAAEAAARGYPEGAVSPLAADYFNRPPQPPPPSVPLALPPGRRVFVPEAPPVVPDPSFVRSIPAEYPEVIRPQIEAPAPPAAPAVSLEELAKSLTGKTLSRLTKAERAKVQTTYDRIQNPLPVTQPGPDWPAATPAAEAPTFGLEYNAPSEARPAATAATTPEAVFMADQPAAARTPESLSYSQQLRDMLEGKSTPEEAARARKVDTLSDYLIKNKIPVSMVDEFGDKEWKMVADQAKVNIPSEDSIKAIRAKLADYESAADLPADVAKMPPAQAEEAFQKAKAKRRRSKPER